MSIAERAPASADSPTPSPTPSRRPLSRVIMHWVRRGHLYLGLFLFPWAVLYGVTAFLFNHPSAFSDNAIGERFGRDALQGTPMETPPTPAEWAGAVVEALQRRAKPGSSYSLAAAPDAKFARDFVSASARSEDGEQVSVFLDVDGGGGFVRAQPKRPEAKRSEPAPFAVGGPPLAKGPRGGAPKGGARRPAADGLALDEPLHERVKAATAVALERQGYAVGEVSVTNMPDLTFKMDADGTEWLVTYNALAGSVSGKKAEDGEPRSISVRRFLLRLHLAHGYPSSVGARWLWALVVDAMAFVMVFWGVSGLFMWWQIKATRRLGVWTLLFSAAAATGLAIGMHRVFTA